MRERYETASGEATKGARIRIADKPVQLPSDAYVGAYIPQVECVRGRICPDPPLYEIRRGSSSITVEARSGAILDERTAPGQEGAFEFLKPALP